MENQMNENTLMGKTVLILGGSSGLGLATAKAAGREGASVMIVSSNQERINKAMKTLPPDSKGYAVDLSEEQNIQPFFESIGPFDHLVYTAGETISLGNIKDTDVEQAKKYFNLRYWGAFTSVKYAASKIKTGGSITLTSGVASPRPGAGWSLGASICSAMEGFTRAMAVELAPIRVNIVSPGIVRTNLWSGMSVTDREALYENIGNSLLVKRVGEAEELAMAFIYLMKQSFSTGQTLIVDGGSVLV